MRSKDSTRLSVLRGILSDITNASKTSSPVKTDMQVLSLLRKRSSAGKAAQVDFEKAGRQDLVQKEEEQVEILREYEGGVEMVEEDEVRDLTRSIKRGMEETGKKVNRGSLMQMLLGPDGIGERPVDRKMVAEIVGEVLQGT